MLHSFCLKVSSHLIRTEQLFASSNCILKTKTAHRNTIKTVILTLNKILYHVSTCHENRSATLTNALE